MGEDRAAAALGAKEAVGRADKGEMEGIVGTAETADGGETEAQPSYADLLCRRDEPAASSPSPWYLSEIALERTF